MNTPKGRFAPSPSGRMHLGNLFSALLAWLSIRSQGGELVLRIEDLDPDRCTAAKAEQLMEDLCWLGLTWDEGGEEKSYWQSRRSPFYEDAFRQLQGQGLIYPCFCTRQQRLSEAPHGHEVSSGCPCATLTVEEAARRALDRSPSYRVRVPQKTIALVDGCQGSYQQDLAVDCGDFLVRRSDGAWAYQLAVVVDDAAMGVTEVVRGQDLLSSTPRQLFLYEALGLPAPRFYHVPLLVAPDGRRLAKRDADLDMGALRQRYAPQELLGILANLSGLLPTPRPTTLDELIGLFAWEKVPREKVVVEGALLG